MKVLHIFTSYPNKYQPYNSRLLEDLSRIDAETEYKIISFGPKLIGNPDVIYINSSDNFHSKLFIFLKRIIWIFKYQSLFKYFLKNYSFLNSLKKFVRYIEIIKLRPDIVHIHHLHLINEEIRQLLKEFSLKWVISVRGNDIIARPLIKMEYKEALMQIFQECYGIHSVGNSLKKVAITNGCDPSKVTVIERSIPSNKQLNLLDKDYNREPVIFTSLSRLSWEKGILYAIEALILLLKKGFKFKYYIIGDGPEYEFLNFRIHQEDAQDSIILSGFRAETELDDLLVKTDFVVMTSLYEGLPNSLKMLQMRGLPAIGTDAGGISEIIVNELTGILVRPGSIEDLSLVFEKILRNPENIRRYKSSCRLHYQDYQSQPEIEVRKYQDFYQKSFKYQLT